MRVFAILLPGLLAGFGVMAVGQEAPPASAHAYFDELRARPEVIGAYSLRDAAQLARRQDGGFSYVNKREPLVTYDPANDPDPRRQDAAKVHITPASNSLRNQVRIPIPPYKGPLLVTWDAWWGKEFRDAGIPTYKAFQIASRNTLSLEIRSRFSLARGGDIAMVDLRYYGRPGPRTVVGAGRVAGVNYGRNQSLGPMRDGFAIAPESWTRYWVLLTPAGDWYECSFWIADEDRGPVQILDKRLVRPKDVQGWNSFWVEMNTSSDGVRRGRPTLVAYVRNVVMLAGLTDAGPLLVRPR